MKKPVSLLSILGAALSAVTVLHAAEPVPSPEQIERGKAVFTEKHCVSCHTADPLNQPGKLPLDKYRMYADPLLFGSVLWNHAGAMLAKSGADPALRAQLEPWPQFQTGEVEALVTYLHWAAGSKQHQYLVGGDAAAGKLVFAERCMACHTGQAGAVGPDLAERLKSVPSAADVAGRMWNHVPQMVKAVNEQHFDFPHLDARQMSDLFAYLLGASKPAVEQR